MFALAAMVLAAGVLVFTNLMSQAGFGNELSQTISVEHDAQDPTVTPFTIPGRKDSSSDASGPIGEVSSAMLVQAVATQQWQWSAIGIAGAGVVSGGLGWLVSRRLLQPIDRITSTAKRISASNLHERIALDGPNDELRRLASTVDDLLDRLQAAFESQRRFVAQASHELRTPLAVQRAALQIGLYEGAGDEEVRATREELLEQNRRTEHLVKSLLVLAEADRGLAGDEQEIDFERLAAEVIADAAENAAAAGVALVHESPPVSSDEQHVTGDPTLVRQLLINLVGNAIEYNELNGFVRVTTRAEGLMVENSGPAVPDDVAPLLIEPFRRCSEVPSGGQHSGLGLSIVASIVQAHGWRLRVSARPEGGLRVDVSSM